MVFLHHLCGSPPPLVCGFLSLLSLWSFPSKSESSHQLSLNLVFIPINSYPICMRLLREETIAAPQWVWLVATVFGFSSILVVGIALFPQSVSGSAPLIAESLPSFLFMIQFRQALTLLVWLCHGLVQAELKRSLIAIANKAEVIIA